MQTHQTNVLSLLEQDTSPAQIAVARIFLAKIIEGVSIDKNIARAAMIKAFGKNDSEGAWGWKDVYEAQEVAMNMFIGKYSPALMKRSPQDIIATFEKLEGCTLTQSRRSDVSVEFQQFSTPLPLGFAAAVAARLTQADKVLEPSAGTGSIAVMGSLYGCQVYMNELETSRHNLLKAQFPNSSVFQLNGEMIDDLMDVTVEPTVILMNPPFSVSPGIVGSSDKAAYKHIRSALARLAPNGRLVAITQETFRPTVAKWQEAFAQIQKSATVVFSAPLSGKIYQRHGTTIDTRITVIDKVAAKNPTDLNAWKLKKCETSSELLKMVQNFVPKRGRVEKIKEPLMRSLFDVAQERGRLEVVHVSNNLKNTVSQPLKKPIVASVKVSNIWEDIIDVDYETIEWRSDAKASDDIYEIYQPQSVQITGAKVHPSKLVQSSAMASVSGPKPTYIPKLPNALIKDGVLSDAQLESVIYAGEAHSSHLSGHWKWNEEETTILAAKPEDEEAFTYRRGWFLGDGTGCGKGRQVAGIIMDNWLKGRKRHVWISKNDKLLEDTRRDWSALGGLANQVVPLSKFKQGEDIKIKEGILFVTYGTLRSGARGDKEGRVDQITNWLGEDFDGCIMFDESHAMANAATSKGARGDKKPSAQGMAGLMLQYKQPDARVVYISATGATEVSNLAYAQRLGLWGSDDTPFINRSDFVSSIESGGVAAMEMISRDLKSLGLYTARSLSYDGVEVDILEHGLTQPQIDIYDSYAKAFYVIHKNIEEALKITNGNMNKGAKAAAKSAFESNKQRFFNHLLCGMKSSSLIKAIEADLEAGRSAVVQVVSTGESLLTRRLAEIPASEWNDLSIDVTPRDYVMDYLDKSFPTNLFQETVDADGNTTSILVTDEFGRAVQNREAVAMKEKMMNHLAGLPPIPTGLDQIIHHFGYRDVAEVTGRSRRIILDDDKLQVSRRSTNANLAESRAFMDDQKRILVFSDAGGTGRSYHADRDCKNQRRRVHYLLEPGWRADNAIQGLGRTNRTNQVSAPICRPVATDVKGEKRFLSTIARRLDTLGAITKGQRQTGGQGLFRAEDNLESDYAKVALRRLFKDIREDQFIGFALKDFEDMTGLCITKVDGNGQLQLPPMSQFLNRVLALTIEVQNALFTRFELILEAVIAQAMEAGTFDQGVEALKAESFKIIDDTAVYTHERSGAVTSCKTILQRDPIEFQTVEEILATFGEGYKPRFMINRKTERAGIAIKGRMMLNIEDGSMVEGLEILRPTEITKITSDKLETSHWENVSQAEWVVVWQREVDNLPEFAEKEFYMITGLLLPIWDKLPKENMRVFRLVTSEGEQILGRLVQADQLSGVYNSLKVAGGIKLSPGEIFNSVLYDRGTFTLENGWKLSRRLVMGESRFEVENVFGTNDAERFKLMGGFSEIIQHRRRCFIPKEAKGIDVVAKILAHTSIVCEG